MAHWEAADATESCDKQRANEQKGKKTFYERKGSGMEQRIRGTDGMRINKRKEAGTF